MAFRFVYQISCNVNKPAFLRNSSVECLRTIRSLSPTFYSDDSATYSNHKYSSEKSRSQSLPLKNVPKTNLFYSEKHKRPMSTARGFDDKAAAEDYTREEKYVPTSGKGYQKKSKHKSRKENIVQKLKPKRVKSFNEEHLNNPEKPQVTRTRPKSAGQVNKDAEVKLHQYHLKDCTPGEKKRNFIEVFEYYSEQHKSKSAKVMPHLQPNNLKPYGTGENLAFPPLNTKTVSIKYPVMETEYAEQVSRSYQNPGRGSDQSGGASSTREYSTSTLQEQELENCRNARAENKPLNSEYGLTDKTTSFLPTSLIEDKRLFQKTVKLISDSNKPEASSVEGYKSHELKKCKNVISEYKKLNPDYKPPKKELKSGSAEEKEAVNNALNFASSLKKYYQAKTSNKQEEQESILSLKNKTVSDLQIREQHQERKKYSFGENTMVLPEVPVTVPTVRKGRRGNLLQSNALPEDAQFWDGFILEENEKLVSPWPSYADQLKDKLQPLQKPTRKEIVYPPMPDQCKTVKNSANSEIKCKDLQLKHSFSTYSLHDTTIKTSIDNRPSPKKLLLQGCIEGTRPSLPELNIMRHFSTSPKGTSNCNEETVAPKRSKPTRENNPLCDSTDFEFPPENSEYFSPDCACANESNLKDSPPLKRLKKRNHPKEPPKICPLDEKLCFSRADDGLKIKPKKLRALVPADNCPCNDESLQEGRPLPRLKKKHVQEPPKLPCQPCVGITCDCPPRADAGLKVKKKILPKLVPSDDCGCTPQEWQDIPLKPLKKVKVPEPKKICKSQQEECIIPRADETRPLKKKSLPKLKMAHCPCTETPALTDVPLARLKKVKQTEPPKICPVIEKMCDTVERADMNLKVLTKQLPALAPKECPCVPLSPPEDQKPLARLKMRNKPQEPPKICPLAEELCLPRADDGLKITLKKLPQIYPAENCQCQDDGLQEGPPLPRLKKKPVKEPKRLPCEPCVGIVCDCPPRADAGLKIKRKCLPRLKPSDDCPCTPQEFEEGVPLKPLKKVKVPEPLKICAPDKMTCTTPRADDGVVTKKKSLPTLKPADCPCVPVPDLQDKRLPRLKKVKVCEPPKICVQKTEICDEEETERADEICGYKVKEKTLQPMILKAKNNHVSTRKFRKNKKKPPTFNVSHKRKFSTSTTIHRRLLSTTNLNSYFRNIYSTRSHDKDGSRVEDNLGSVTSKLTKLTKFKKGDINWKNYWRNRSAVTQNPRADDTWHSKKRCLPKLVAGKCPCLEDRERLDQNQPHGKRLPKYDIRDVDGNPSSKVCVSGSNRNPRTDDNYKIKKKASSKLRSSGGPFLDQRATLVDIAPLNRLPKHEEPAKDLIRVKFIVESYGVPRAEERLMYRRRNLPKLQRSTENKTFPDIEQPNLKRLPLFKKTDVDWKAVFSQNKNYLYPPKTNATMKIKKKSAPNIRKSDSPCYESTKPFVDVKPLKRLPKFKISDPNWTSPNCNPRPQMASRANENLRTKSKSLPELNPSKCPCILQEPPLSSRSNLKRLPKFKIYDDKLKIVGYKQNPEAQRTNQQLIDKKKSLPRLKKSDFAYIYTTKVQDVQPLKHLPKFRKDYVSWYKPKKYVDEIKYTTAARAVDSLPTKSKSLPQLKSNLCLNVDVVPPLEMDASKLKRLDKLEVRADAKKTPCLKGSSKCIISRADELLGYEVRQKKLLPLLPAVNKSCYHTISRLSYSIHSSNRNLGYTQHQMINTTAVSYAKKKECKKMPPPSSKKAKCVKLRLPGCKPKVRERCDSDYVFKPCTKQKSPYPSFSESATMPDYPRCECYPVLDLSFLQPNQPIIRNTDLPPAPPPDYALIDPVPEEECVRKKLGIKFQGETKTCSDFDKPSKQFNAKEMLVKAEAEAEAKAKEEGTSLKEIRDKALKEACCQNKAKSGNMKKKECPIVDTDTCCIGEPILEEPGKKKPAEKKPKKDKAKGSKSGMICTPVVKRDKVKSTKSGQLCKQRSRPNTALLYEKAHQKSLWQRIKNFFSPQPPTPSLALEPCGPKSKKDIKSKSKCSVKPKPKQKPKPKDCSKEEKKEDSSKFKECKKPPKAICQPEKGKRKKTKSKEAKSKKSKSAVKAKPSKTKAKPAKAKKTKAKKAKAKAAKPPTKKGASKVTKKPVPKKAKVKKGKKSKSASSKSKSKKKIEKKAKPKKSKKSKSSTKSKTAIEKKSSKKSLPPKSAKKEKRADKKRPASEPKPKLDKKEKPEKKSKSAEECKISKPEKEEKVCSEPKEDKKVCSEPKEDENSKFAKMFPPDMPDCRPRMRVRRVPPSSSPTKSCAEPAIPMDACSRKECVVEIVECPPQKPKKSVCEETESKSKSDDCKPKKKAKSDDCKPKKKTKAKSECPPENVPKDCKADKEKPDKGKAPQQSGKCKKFQVDCPPKARDSCEEGYVWKTCTTQESPYPSYSECHPPLPKLKTNECIIARNRAKQTLTKLIMNVNKSETNKNKCDDKEKKKKTATKKGKRSYSTMSAVARAFAFHTPKQWGRHYSSSTKGRGSKSNVQLLKETEKAEEVKPKGNDVLNQRLLASIEEGIEKLESQEMDLPKNPYYQILKALQKLSEKEIYDFFDQEPQFNPFNPLKSDVRETVSFVCKLNPRAENALFSNDITFQPGCVGISDPTANREEMKIIEAFRNLCNRMCEGQDTSDIPYEELERIKTEDMKQQLNDLLRRSKGEQ